MTRRPDLPTPTVRAMQLLEPYLAGDTRIVMTLMFGSAGTEQITGVWTTFRAARLVEVHPAPDDRPAS
jgi:hypothetical protein